MKLRTLLLALAVLGLMIALVSGCPGGDEEQQAGPDGAAPGEMVPRIPEAGGIPGEAGGPGGGGPMGPEGMPMGPGGPGGPMGMGQTGQGTAAQQPAQPEEPPASMEEIVEMKEKGDTAKAARQLERMLEDDPDNARAHWILAQIMIKEGTSRHNPIKVRKAKEHFKKFIELSDDEEKISEARAALDRVE